MRAMRMFLGITSSPFFFSFFFFEGWGTENVKQAG